MKILLIPDMHGSHNWEQAKDYIGKVDKIIFLGDYVDSGVYDPKIKAFRSTNKWPDQGENLRNILAFGRQYPDTVDVCWGNHDWQYISMGRNCSCSGAQPDHANEIKSILTANKDILKVAVEYDGWVFSHAGFSNTWVADIKKALHTLKDKWPEEDDGDSLVWNESEFSVKFLSDTVAGLSHYYDNDCAPYIDELLDWHGIFSGSGNESFQGPLWIRPEALLGDAHYPQQVVGHTEMCVGEPARLSSKNGKILVLDSTDHELLYEFDTEKESEKKYLDIAAYNRQQKTIRKTLGTIWSMQLRDEDAIRNELLNGGVKKSVLEAYVKIVKERF